MGYGSHSHINDCLSNQILFAHMELLNVKLHMSGEVLVYGGKLHKDV